MGVSLISGWLPWLLILLGLAGAAFLMWRRERWWWLYVVPGVAVVAVTGAWLIGRFVGAQLFAEPLPVAVAGWIGIAIAGIGLSAGSLGGTRWPRKLGAAAGAALVVLFAGSQINTFYVQYPTLGDILGVTSAQQIAGPPPIGPTTSAPSSTPRPAGPLATAWTPTGANIPADGKGRVSQIDLPGPRSGFTARPGWVYYPPAYFADNPEPMPVLVLLAGQPGEPHDWLLGDRLQSVMDTFAAQHNGIAPVVVLPDALGSQLANPICADSSLGQVDTYLSVDVPATILAQLRVDPTPAHWAIGGFSYGGTCAIQMATNHPQVYPNFVDISGQLEPTLGSRQQTVSAVFGGDEAKFRAINPLDIMASRTFPNTAGWFTAGSLDSETDRHQRQLHTAALAAGMDAQYWSSPGSGHDWNAATDGLAHVMPWLGKRTSITA